MSGVVGGLRARLIKDSLFSSVDTSLRELGWYDTDRRHLPFRFLAKPLPWDEEVPRNTLGLAFEGNDTEEWEVGSGLTNDTIQIRFDFYAENDAIGVDVSNDIRDILRGRLAVGPSRASFKIYDYRQATPPQIGYVIVDDVVIERPATLAERFWQRNWFQIRCVLRDAYIGELTE